MNEEAVLDSDEMAYCKLSRVYFEGDHPDEGPICVLLLLIPRYEGKGMKGICFMRVAEDPSLFKVGQNIGIMESNAWIRYPNGRHRSLSKIGATQSEYNNPGKIFIGG